jgi:RNA polymerase sigma-70 factor (ECF subfamily)
LGFFTPVEEELDLESSSMDNVDVRLNTEDLLKILDELPEGARMVFHLYAVEGYSHKEIAQKLEVSESTSKSQYQRARTLLIQRISQKEAG